MNINMINKNKYLVTRSPPDRYSVTRTELRVDSYRPSSCTTIADCNTVKYCSCATIADCNTVKYSPNKCTVKANNLI